jgi:hypothetical protein
MATENDNILDNHLHQMGKNIYIFWRLHLPPSMGDDDDDALRVFYHFFPMWLILTVAFLSHIYM